jgi:hypothetical protein
MNLTNTTPYVWNDCELNVLPDGSPAPLHAFDDATVIYIGAALSGFSSIFIIATYARFRWLRRQPNTLVFMRSIYDLLLALTIAVLSPPIVGVLDEHTKRYNNEPRCDPCLHTTTWGGSEDGIEIPGYGHVLSFLTQFSYAGAELCQFFVALDLAINLVNPFADFKRNNTRYFIASLVCALVSATLLISPVWPEVVSSKAAASNDDGANGESYVLSWGANGNGLFTLGFCWTGSRRGRFFNSALWVLFVLPIMINLVFNAVVYCCARSRLNAGLSRTFIVRLVVLRMTNGYVMASFLWTVLTMLSYAAVQTPFYIEWFTPNYSVDAVNACVVCAARRAGPLALPSRSARAELPPPPLRPRPSAGTAP